jgi:hypothetical protein
LKKTVLMTLAAGFVWSVVGVGSAHAQLSRSEQLFLYLNYYQNQRNTQTIRADQAKQQQALDKMGQQQSVIARNTALPEPAFSRYVAPGRSSPQVERAHVPPIYSGQGGQRNYFLQQNRFFNPPR